MADNAVKIPFTEAAAPSTPAAGKVVVYAKADGLMYSKDDAGTETLMSGGAGGGSVATDAIWDAAGDLAVGTGANTAARLAIGANATVLTSNGTTASWAAPAAGSPWTLAVDEDGTSFANWANDISTHWSSDATTFLSNPGTGNTGKARYTAALLGAPCRMDCEVFFDSTGTSQAGGSTFTIGLGSSANPSNGPVGGLRMVSNNPAANGQAYIEKQGTTPYNGTTSTFALDTWLTLSVVMSGSVISVSKGGTVIWTFKPDLPAVTTVDSLLMVNYQSKVKVRNVKVYQLTAP